MRKNIWIRNLADLAAHVDADDQDIESISRRVYEDTEDGAWVDTWDKPVHHPLTFKIGVKDTAEGPQVISWCQRGRPYKMDRPHGLMPPELERYLCLNTSHIIQDMLFDRLPGLPLDDILKAVEVRGPGDIVLTVRVNCVVRHDPCIVISSVITGTDTHLSPEYLTFPFTGTEFDKAVKNAEAHTNLWNTTHGCEACDPENHPDGGGPINPDCTVCDGTGIAP